MMNNGKLALVCRYSEQEADKIIDAIIHTDGYINLDAHDVEHVCEGGSQLILVDGTGNGEHRLQQAFSAAKASIVLPQMPPAKALVSVWMSDSTPLTTTEMELVSQEIEHISADDVTCGISIDQSLNNSVKVVLLLAY